MTQARVYYLPAGPRLAEAHDHGTVEPLTVAARSAPKALASPNIMHTQHLRDNQHRDVKTRPAQLVFTEGHPPNHLPKGRYKGAGRRGMYKGGARGGTGSTRPVARPPSTRRTEITSMCRLIGGPTGCLGAEEEKNHSILTVILFFFSKTAI